MKKIDIILQFTWAPTERGGCKRGTFSLLEFEKMTSCMLPSYEISYVNFSLAPSALALCTFKIGLKRKNWRAEKCSTALWVVPPFGNFSAGAHGTIALIPLKTSYCMHVKCWANRRHKMAVMNLLGV